MYGYIAQKKSVNCTHSTCDLIFRIEILNAIATAVSPAQMPLSVKLSRLLAANLSSP
jgi:hypothetical protein